MRSAWNSRLCRQGLRPPPNRRKGSRWTACSRAGGARFRYKVETRKGKRKREEQRRDQPRNYAVAYAERMEKKGGEGGKWAGYHSPYLAFNPKKRGEGRGGGSAKLLKNDNIFYIGDLVQKSKREGKRGKRRGEGPILVFPLHLVPGWKPERGGERKKSRRGELYPFFPVSKSLILLRARFPVQKRGGGEEREKNNILRQYHSHFMFIGSASAPGGGRKGGE